MPLRKFRSIDEMNECAQDSTTDYTARQEVLVSLVSDLVPTINKRGVQKFRTIEEANEARLQAEIERSRFMGENKR